MLPRPLVQFCSAPLVHFHTALDTHTDDHTNTEAYPDRDWHTRPRSGSDE